MRSKSYLGKVFAVILTLVLFIASVNPIYAADKKIKNAPSIYSIVATDNYVQLKWTKANKASKYYVYKKTENSKYKLIAKVDNKTRVYIDKKVSVGTKYTYKIVSKRLLKRYSSKSKTVTPVTMKAPNIISLKKCTASNNKEYVKLSWESKQGYNYYIYRKTTGKFVRVAIVKAKGNTCSYIDRELKSDVKYTYTVKAEKIIGKTIHKFSDYDREGITILNGKPNVSVNFTNLHANVSWDKMEEADGYYVYRKIGLSGEYRKIATISSNDILNYEDVYQRSFTLSNEKDQLVAGYYIDPSSNKIVYTVRGYKNFGQQKVSYSDYYKDGDFLLEPPSVVSVTKNSRNKATIEWSTIKNAKKYYIYTGYNDANGLRHWKRVSSVTHKSTTRQKATINVEPGHTYFTVKAVSVKNGNNVYSSYDKGFCIDNRKFNDKNVLYIGDSITFGSPYKGATTKEVFSYPWRVNQLTGVQYYNPSIPGATYTYKESKNRYRLITDVAERIKDGKTPLTALHENKQTYKDFDIVIMAAGTNDYLDDAQFGDIDSTDITEFNGAINTIIDYIKEGNNERIKEGKTPIKVVFVDLFYSDRTYDYSQCTNRFTTTNHNGYTLTDYQNDIDVLVDKYKEENKGENDMKFYQFDTTSIVTQDNCPYATSDNLHMTRFTYTQIGNMLTKYLIDNGIL